MPKVLETKQYCLHFHFGCRISFAPCNAQNNSFQTRRVPPPADYGQADCIDMIRSPKLLQYYDKYSETGCKIECETSYIMKQCGGCRPFLSPREFM